MAPPGGKGSSKTSHKPRIWPYILFALLGAFTALFYYLDQHLEQFYIFETDHLYDLAQRAISTHGNNTAGVVSYIVGELSEKLPGGYVNLDEEWIFNNAGGAMGAMYIIHASSCNPATCTV